MTPPTKELNHQKAVELAVDEIVDQLRARDESGDRPTSPSSPCPSP